MTFKAGQYVHHTKYGNGIIVERDDDRTTVDFDTAGVKKFVTAIASFEVAQGEAPKKKRTARRPKPKTTEVGTPVAMS
ncbi:MAG TPA: hypothetical protein VL523_02765 [Terriglobia bacterium]|nr:hypothetical protein [Terriglobia bacterium]